MTVYIHMLNTVETPNIPYRPLFGADVMYGEVPNPICVNRCSAQ